MLQNCSGREDQGRSSTPARAELKQTPDRGAQGDHAPFEPGCAAKKAREILPETLRENGAEVEVVTVYQNVRPKDYAMVREELAAGDIDMVTFTSSSTVTNFLEMLGNDREKLLAGVQFAAIGPITARTAKKHGLVIDLQPSTYTIPALVDAIVDSYS